MWFWCMFETHWSNLMSLELWVSYHNQHLISKLINMQTLALFVGLPKNKWLMNLYNRKLHSLWKVSYCFYDNFCSVEGLKSKLIKTSYPSFTAAGSLWPSRTARGKGWEQRPIKKVSGGQRAYLISFLYSENSHSLPHSRHSVNILVELN